MKLTAEQQKLVEQNQKLIFWSLKRFGFSIDEYYGAAAVGLCKAAMHWDSTKSAFSSFASAVIRNEILMEKRTENKLPQNPTSLDALVPFSDDDSSETDLYGQIAAPDLFEPAEDHQDIKKAIAEAKAYMSDIQFQALGMYAQGAKQREIAKHLGITQSYVARVLKSSTAKISSAYNGEHISKVRRRKKRSVAA